MKRTTGLCLLFGLLAVGGLLALFVLPRGAERSIAPVGEPDGAASPRETIPPAGGTGLREPGTVPVRPPGPGEEPGEEPALEPAPPGAARAKGRVAGPDGSPVAGALAYWTRGSEPLLDRDALPALARTGEDGTFGMRVPAGVGVLVVLAGGLRPATRALEAEPDGVTDLGTITLDAGLSISGRIVDTEGAPVAGADAVAYREAALGGGGLLPGPARLDDLGGRAASDERGEFEVRGLAEGLWRLRPEGMAIAPAGDDEEVRAGAANVTLVVRRLRVATGLVVAEADRDEPVAGANVSVTVRGDDWGESLITQTDGEGRFLVDLSGGRYEDPELVVAVAVAADGFEDREIEGLAPAAVAPDAGLVIPLVRAAPVQPGRLRGRVLYETGDPFVGGITLSFAREGKPSQVFRVETEEDGAYLVEGIAPGEYHLRTAPRRDRVLLDTGKRLVIPPGGEEVADLTVPRGGDLRLTVLDSRGDPVPELRVEVTDGEGEPAGAWTGSLSGHVLLDLPPGEVTVRVSAPGFAPTERAVTIVKDERVPLRVVLDRR